MKKIFYADLRTLALVRFSLGLIVFYDFFRKLSYAQVFYSDSGILSRSVLLGKFHNIWKPSLLFLNGSTTFAVLLLVIGMIASLFYIFGVRTKISNFLMWIILISFHERFSLALNAGDILVTLLLFWSFFLPMGAVASWDSVYRKEEESLPVNYQTTSIFTIAWIGQIFFIYIFTFLYKWHPNWYREGTTLYYALQLESFTTPIGQWLLNFPKLLKVLSISTLWLEGMGPWLLLLPFWNSQFRYIIMAAFIGLHIGIGITLEVGTFVPTCITLWLFLLPSDFWEWAKKKALKSIPKTTYQVYYDKDCGFCRRMANIFVNIFCCQNVIVQSSESDSKVHKLIVQENSWAGKNDKGEILFHWDNFRELLRYSPLFGVSKALRFLPLGIGKRLYYLVANNRPFFARLMGRVGHSALWLRPGKLLTSLGLFFFLLAFLYNLDGYSNGKPFRLNKHLRNTSILLRLDQKWNMYAPYPSRIEGWFVADGTLKNGQKVDPWRNKPVDFSRPKNIGDEFSSNVWRKVMLRFQQKDKYDYLLYLGKYICRRWNNKIQTENYKLESFDLYFMKEISHGPNESPKPIEKIKLWGHLCFKKTEWPR